MPKHIVRLILLIVAFGVVAVSARYFLVDKSFYEYGHYRGNAVAEIAQDKRKYQGTTYCQSCHAAQFAEWSKGVHDRTDIGKVVKCEVCHGPGGKAISTHRPAQFTPTTSSLPSRPTQGRSARSVTSRCRGDRCNRPRS
jgi:hypothetical protein